LGARTTDLIDLHQDRVGIPTDNSLFEPRDLGNEYIIADKLAFGPEGLGQQFPTLPDIFWLLRLAKGLRHGQRKAFGG
jgi:hypothetical protein